MVILREVVALDRSLIQIPNVILLTILEEEDEGLKEFREKAWDEKRLRQE